jgi:hypothetical protein
MDSITMEKKDQGSRVEQKRVRDFIDCPKEAKHAQHSFHRSDPVRNVTAWSYRTLNHLGEFWQKRAS